ncbi:RluA family pseudouridine synthase [Rubellimicrobium rubrum]|uniref:Pseudouridine synthase n=1 Tax=Rubellimicrobium rubrum TaxID=2585369 RepID=A0A5C4MRN3_9RHOB|nr:RluA family pseudouridine synthase [Rubellimicrobium rubrum]TNC48031.1 RluA family pseudouridine synthase [Rubellimicrobium rubrum]
MSKRVSFQIAADPPRRLDKALARDVPDDSLSRSRLAKLINDGAVSIDGSVLTDPSAAVAAGSLVEIVLGPAEESHIGPENIPLHIVWEDADLIVVDKPAGMVVHPAPGTPSGTLVNALIHHCGASLSGVGGMLRPGIVHRIDKDTSGLLVAAKSDRAHQGLAAQFEAHDVERHYLAVCHGVPDASDPRLAGLRGIAWESGGILKIATRLDRHRADRQRQAVTWEGGRHAVTRTRVVRAFGQTPAAALLDCWLETGRTHQIRVHLAYAGHGLAGDPVYGGQRKPSVRALGEVGADAISRFPRQALHAATLGFRHPVTNEMLRFESALPSDLAELVRALDG